jgi:probable rRNA maturation factor
MECPEIAITVAAGDWPPQAALTTIAERAVRAACAAMREPGEQLPFPAARELSIVFTDDAGIRRLNREWRGKDSATNVLSFPQAFPQAGGPQAGGPEPGGMILGENSGSGLLGDVILAAETVRGEAVLAGKPLEDHMAHLIVHGFLHLLGYDHEADDEAEKMEQLERLALKGMGLPDPYASA